jgi:hypothetical protein
MKELEFLFNEINLLGILKQFHSETYEITKTKYNSIHISKLNQDLESYGDYACQHVNYLITTWNNVFNFWVLKDKEFVSIKDITVRKNSYIKGVESYKNLIILAFTGKCYLRFKVYSLVKKSRSESDYRCVQTVKVGCKSGGMRFNIIKYKSMFILNTSMCIKFYKLNAKGNQLVEINIINVNCLYDSIIYHNMLVYSSWDCVHCYNLDTKITTTLFNFNRGMILLHIKDDKLMVARTDYGYGIKLRSHKTLLYEVKDDILSLHEDLGFVYPPELVIVLCKFTT